MSGFLSGFNGIDRLSPFSREFKRVVNDGLRKATRFAEIEERLHSKLAETRPSHPAPQVVFVRITNTSLVRTRDRDGGGVPINVEWDYEWQLLEYYHPDWADRESDIATQLPLKNLCEEFVSPEVHGSGIEYRHLLPGFNINPIPERIVPAYWYPTEDNTFLWMSEQNQVGGFC